MPPDPRIAPVADVTVIIPAYRAEQTIGRALASVAGQTLKPRAAVVVDDGSPDGTKDAALAWRDRMEGVRLTVIGQPNAGPGAARNRAIAEAETEYLAFLDADDEWLPEKLARTMPRLEGQGVCFVSHNYFAVENGKQTAVDCTVKFKTAADPYLTLFRGNFIDTSTVVARRDAVMAVGGFNETLPSAQDYELWLSMAGRPGARFQVFADPLSRYHIRPNTVSSNIALRRDCAVRIMNRQLGELRHHRRFPLSTPLAALKRCCLIAYETVNAYRATRRIGAAAATLARLPADLIAVLWRLMGATMPGESEAPEFGAGDAGAGADRRSTPSALAGTRADIRAAAGSDLDRNRDWWERLPMTYAEWGATARIPESEQDFRAIRQRIYATGPFFREHYDPTLLKGFEVLDLGCGSGAFSSLLAEGGANVTAVDLTEAAVTITRRSAEAWGFHIPVARMDAERSAFADESFDYVFSWGVLHHTPDTEQALREVARVLKPAGTGILMVYHKTSIVYYLNGLFWLLCKGKLFRGHTLKTVQGFYTDGYYHRHFTRSGLHRALTGAGLRPDRIFVTQMQKKILPLIPRALDEWLKSRLGWLIVAEFGRADGR